jgi:hypothetical protein
MTVPDQDRVAGVLRSAADRKGVVASTDLLLSAYCIAYQSSNERDDAALEWIVGDAAGKIDSHLIAEAMLREWASWSCPMSLPASP